MFKSDGDMSTPESSSPERRIFMQLPTLHLISIQLALLQRSVFMLTLNILVQLEKRPR